MKLTEDQARQFARDVTEASGNASVAAAVSDLYAHVQAEIDARQPVCQISGRCCRFEQFGHRLFVTTIEMAAFLRDLSRPAATIGAAAGLRLPLLPAPWDGTGCPYQVAGRCGVHPARPFGCRIFFCDATAEAWQQQQYERFHAEIRRLHERFGVPYFYVEWREAIRAVGLAEPAAAAHDE